MKSVDLRQRTKDFALRVIRLAESLPAKPVGRVIRDQMLRAGTSVGANYRAAQRAKSPADFVSKMGTVEEEADETMYWIELSVAAGLIESSLVDSLCREADEILSMVVASIKTAKRRG
jgi:four helix bundle protein